MTLVSTIIRDAYRESNLIAISADPSAAEQAEGLRLLNRYILSLIGNEAGDPLETIPIGQNNISRPTDFPGYTDQPESSQWYVPNNARLVLNLTSPQTVYLSPKPVNGSRLSIQDKSGNLATHNLTVNGNGYTIADATSVTLNTDNLNREYFFRADTGNWAVVSSLAAADQSPFPEKYDDLLIVALAIRLNPRNGAAIDEQSLAAFKTTLKKFRAEYNKRVDVQADIGLLRLPNNRLNGSFIDITDNDVFNQGHI